MSALKTCVTCKHYTDDERCDAAPPVLDPVTGEMKPNWRQRPSLSREDGWLSSLIMQTCGLRARWWEAK